MWYAKGGPAKDVVGGQGKSLHASGKRLKHGKATELTLSHLGASGRDDETNKGAQECRTQRGDHEKGKETSLGEHSHGISANLEEENMERLWAKKQTVEVMQWEKRTQPEAEIPFEFKVAPNVKGVRDEEGPISVDKENGPMAMNFDDELGWVAEKLGPRSGH